MLCISTSVCGAARVASYVPDMHLIAHRIGLRLCSIHFRHTLTLYGVGSCTSLFSTSMEAVTHEQEPSGWKQSRPTI